MQSQQKRAKAVARQRPTKEAEMDAAQIAANSYCLRHYAVGYTGGAPLRLSLRGTDLWIVPVVFTSSGCGLVGEVGVVAIDAATQDVLGATPQEDVKAAGARLAREKRDEITAAFQRARKP
jgi:hypothetical protein